MSIISAPQVIPSFEMNGFKVVDSVEYATYQCDGKFPFKDIQSNKYFINGIPAIYLISLDIENFKKFE